MAPGPSISAIVYVVCFFMTTLGLIFHVWPKSRAGPAPVPVVAIPPLPFSPLKFSGLIDRVWASDKRYKLPRLTPSPLNFSCAQADKIITVSETIKTDLFIVSIIKFIEFDSIQAPKQRLLTGRKL